MRILHVFDHSLPLQSGYVTRSLGIIRSQQARGWQTIQVTTPRYQPSDSPVEVVDGVAFHRTAEVRSKLPIIRELLEIAATRKRLAEIVRSESPDVIHAHSPVLNVLAALPIGRRFGLPVVYEVRALWEDAAVDHGTSREGGLRYRLSRAIDTWAMRRASFVAPICEPLRHEIVARGIAAEKVAVVPNAVDRSLLDTKEEPSDPALRAELGAQGKMVLGFIGSFYAYEGLDMLLEAAAHLRRRRSDFLVLLVGGGPEEDRLKAQAHELSLGGCVRFVGRVHHSEVGRYYRLIDLLVFPRKRSRLTDLVTPLKPLEAMAQRKPVLASDVGGHRELIRDGETGFLFPAGDEALTSSIADLLENPTKRSSVVMPGQRFVASERTWDRLCERYAEIYAWLGLIQ